MRILLCLKSFCPLSDKVVRKFVLFLSCIFLPFFHAFAGTERHISFSSLSIEDGLSQSTVLSITQDMDGNIWFATLDGLNRYDGYDFTIFRHDADDEKSIANSWIRAVFTDSGGNVLSGTENGLSMYDHVTSGFINFQIPSGHSKSVRCMAEMPQGRLLVATLDSLYTFDLESKVFSESPFAGIRSMERVTALCPAGNIMYVGTSDGKIFLYCPESRELREIFSAGFQINCLMNQNASLWAGTEGGGLFLLNLHSGESRSWRHSDSRGSLSSNHVRAIETDADGQVWIGTVNGLNIYRPGSGTFEIYGCEPFVSGSLAQKSVRCIFRDSQGGMWLGTYFGGINWWHPLKDRFRNIRMRPGANSLNDNIISCIVEDHEGCLWIGTHSGGINRYNPETETFSHYMLSQGGTDDDIGSEDIKSILIDGNRLYIGAHGNGLNVLDRRTGRMRACGGGKGRSAPNDIYSVLKDESGFLWIGSLEGLYRYRPDHDTFEAVRQDSDDKELDIKQIKILHMDSSHHLYVGTETGLGIFETSESGLRRISIPISDSIGNVSVQCMLENDGHTWVATSNGLFRIDCDGGEILHYTVSDGLPNNNVNGIEVDQSGRLWLSSDCGLSCFTPGTGKFRNFTIADGLQSNEFNVYAHCSVASGQMYFGGINGITTFNPERLIDNPYAPEPVISKLMLFNVPVIPGDDNGILQKSLSRTDHLTFRHFQNSISLEFAVPNYLSGRHNTFAYMLQGIDRQWVQLPAGKRDVSYSNLPHGKYVFMVKVANNDGIWSGIKELRITVRPAWYQTLVVRIILTAIAILVIGLAAKLIVDKKAREAMTARIMKIITPNARKSGDGKSLTLSDEELLQRAAAIVGKNIDNPEFSVEDFAAAMNMSRSNLHTKLKSLTGESALDFIRRIRFKEACRLLAEGRLSISEISWKVGFSSPSYFATSFKKQFGYHPSKYQQNN